MLPKEKVPKFPDKKEGSVRAKSQIQESELTLETGTYDIDLNVLHTVERTYQAQIPLTEYEF